MSESTRALVYRALLAVIPILTFYGVLTEEAAGVWLAALAGFLGAGLAARNTSRG